MLSAPKLDCWVTSMNAGYDVHGQPLAGARVQTKCAPVRLMSGTEKTSVRADSSASRGNADEVVSDARLLFMTSAVINFGDKLEVAGTTLKVAGIFPRHDVNGVLDHLQVDANIWA